MNPDSSKLQSREQQASAIHSKSAHEHKATDFASVEELLRYDAAQPSSPY
jgi:hypothetical protein